MSAVPGNELVVDSTVLRNVQASCADVADSIPQHSIVDVAGCGSSAVASAVADFDMWAVLVGRADAEGIQVLASQLGAVAEELERVDAELAAGVTG